VLVPAHFAKYNLTRSLTFKYTHPTPPTGSKLSTIAGPNASKCNALQHFFKFKPAPRPRRQPGGPSHMLPTFRDRISIPLIPHPVFLFAILHPPSSPPLRLHLRPSALIRGSTLLRVSVVSPPRLHFFASTRFRAASNSSSVKIPCSRKEVSFSSSTLGFPASRSIPFTAAFVPAPPTRAFSLPSPP
jgi:hypothetical protein